MGIQIQIEFIFTLLDRIFTKFWFSQEESSPFL